MMLTSIKSNKIEIASETNDSILTYFIISKSFTFLEDKPRGEYQKRRFYKGPKGGCYYKHKDGTKVYVDKSNCSC